MSFTVVHLRSGAPLALATWIPGNPSIFGQWLLEPINFEKINYSLAIFKRSISFVLIPVQHVGRGIVRISIHGFHYLQTGLKVGDICKFSLVISIHGFLRTRGIRSNATPGRAKFFIGQWLWWAGVEQSLRTHRLKFLTKPLLPKPKTENPQSVLPYPQAIQVLRDLQEWKLVPDSLYQDTSKKPLESLIYGPIHLLRLFVKLPEIIGLMSTMPVKKKKLVLKYMDSVLEYLQSHQDFFQ